MLDLELTHSAAHQGLGFIRKYVFSLDHKIVGLQYLFTALAMAIFGGLLSMLMRLQLGWPSKTPAMMADILPNMYLLIKDASGHATAVMKPELYLSLQTMHGTIMAIFVLTALFTGAFGNFLIPLQIGARDMAFALLNLLSFWVYAL